MEIRSRKESFSNWKTPVQGVTIVVLSCLGYLAFLGVLVVIVKLLMG